MRHYRVLFPRSMTLKLLFIEGQSYFCNTEIERIEEEETEILENKWKIFVFCHHLTTYTMVGLQFCARCFSILILGDQINILCSQKNSCLCSHYSIISILLYLPFVSSILKACAVRCFWSSMFLWLTVYTGSCLRKKYSTACTAKCVYKKLLLIYLLFSGINI